MKITIEYGMGREVVEVDSVTVTSFLVAAGDKIIAELKAEMGMLIWQDEDGKRIGAITVEESGSE